jgi:hypothetical protein
VHLDISFEGEDDSNGKRSIYHDEVFMADFDESNRHHPDFNKSSGRIDLKLMTHSKFGSFH